MNCKSASKSGLSDSDIQFLRRMLFRKIELIHLRTFPSKTFNNAIELNRNIGEFDTQFIALSIGIETPFGPETRN